MDFVLRNMSVCYFLVLSVLLMYHSIGRESLRPCVKQYGLQETNIFSI